MTDQPMTTTTPKGPEVMPVDVDRARSCYNRLASIHSRVNCMWEHQHYLAPIFATHRIEHAAASPNTEAMRADVVIGLREYARGFQHGEKVWPREFIENAISYALSTLPATMGDGRIADLFPPLNPGDPAEALTILLRWRADSPLYDGEDPRAVHYRGRIAALDAAIAALAALPLPTTLNGGEAEKLGPDWRKVVTDVLWNNKISPTGQLADDLVASIKSALVAHRGEPK